jgi:hypothetical protein
MPLSAGNQILTRRLHIEKLQLPTMKSQYEPNCGQTVQPPAARSPKRTALTQVWQHPSEKVMNLEERNPTQKVTHRLAISQELPK